MIFYLAPSHYMNPNSKQGYFFITDKARGEQGYISMQKKLEKQQLWLRTTNLLPMETKGLLRVS